MHIANPIYDVVFKYLMDDSKIAKLLLSTIIEEEVIELSFLPQEKIGELARANKEDDSRPPLTVYRLDFSATIKTPQGSKQVIIEIQKAKFATDIMRFRKYLGEHYQKAHVQVIDGKEREKALPLLSIYFLGRKLEHITRPLIKVKRHYYDLISKKEIKEKEEFIESLTHDSFIIQIPQLRERYQTEAEQLLSVFDQKQITEDHHILNIKDEDHPEKHQPLIRRLQRAIAEPKVRQTMDIEDEVLTELENMDRKVDDLKQDLAEKVKVITEKDQALAENQQVITEKDQVLAENQQVITEKDQALAEKDQALAEKGQALTKKDQVIEQLRQKLGEQNV